MEEAAQILEIETFIPMLLQESRHGDDPRLKRVVLIGDHHQLPPVVKNVAFQKYSHLDQSLFTRFVRLGLPTVQLDAQVRAGDGIGTDGGVGESETFSGGAVQLEVQDSGQSTQHDF